MKFRRQINLFALIVPIIMACCIVTIGTMVINRTVCRLNRRVLLREVTAVAKTIEAKHRVLVEAGVSRLPNYIAAVKEELLQEITEGAFDISGQLYILAADGSIVFPPRSSAQYPSEPFPDFFTRCLKGPTASG